MQKISQVGKQLREKSKQKEQQLQMELQESLQRLEKSLTTLFVSSLTRIESDMIEDSKAKIKKLINANHHHYKKTMREEQKQIRKIQLFLFPFSLVFGLMLGIFSTLYLSQSKVLIVKESDMVKAEDGTQYLPINKIPNLEIIKEESE